MIVDINDYLNVFSSSNYSDDSDKDEMKVGLPKKFISICFNDEKNDNFFFLS